MEHPNNGARICLGRRVQRNPDCSFGFENVTHDRLGTALSSLFLQPTLLCLGGDSTIYDQHANGYAKFGQFLLGRQKEYASDLQIVSVTYPTNLNNVEIDFSPASRDRDPVDIPRDFAETYLRPLVEVYQNGSPEGRVLDTTLAARNCRNLNVFAHSFGGLFINMLGQAMHEMMNEIGYSSDEISSIMSQVLVVTAGSVGNLRDVTSLFSGYHFVNIKDEVMHNSSSSLAAIGDHVKSITTNKPINIFKANGKESDWIIAIRSDQNERDETKHLLHSYFPSEPNIATYLASCILSNGMSNSVENHANATPDFVALPGMIQLTRTPYETAYKRSVDHFATDKEYSTLIRGRTNSIV